MKKWTHTPGPWAILPEEVDKSYIRVRGSALGCRYKIANVITPVYDGIHEREAMETRANARLIAAAPDLLATLKAFSGFTDDATVGDKWIERVRAVIAQAEGRK